MDVKKSKFRKLFKFLIALAPLSFLFTYLEINLPKNSSLIGLIVCLSIVIIIAFQKLSFSWLLLSRILALVLSIFLAKIFIVAPNESWFKPFTLEGSLIFLEFIIFLGLIFFKELGQILSKLYLQLRK